MTMEFIRVTARRSILDLARKYPKINIKPPYCNAVRHIASDGTLTVDEGKELKPRHIDEMPIESLICILDQLQADPIHE